jgi:hypothetical protein
MKTLYESILDDEDVLIGNIKKDFKNPFVLLDILLFKYSENVEMIPKEFIDEVIKLLKLPKINNTKIVQEKSHWRHQRITMYDNYSRRIIDFEIDNDDILFSIGAYGKAHEDLFGDKKNWENYIDKVLIKEFSLSPLNRVYKHTLKYHRK